MPKSARSGDVYLVLALLLSLLAALPLLIGPGIVNTRAGGDAPFLVQRVQQLSQNQRAGVFPARWMPDGAQGLGYPFFNFYAALPYYLASLLNLAGCGVLWGIKLTQTLGFLLAGGMMYMLARQTGARPPTALLASAVYTFAPFHLANVYVRGDALSEFYALSLYPLILWALLKLGRRPSPAHIALLAGCYASLILSHNISALIFSPLVGLWLLAMALTQPAGVRWKVLRAGALALGLGLLLSAWFWAPALREQSLVQLQDQTTGYFNYAGHFRTANLVQWRPIHDYTLTWDRDPFNMGLVQGALALVSVVSLIVSILRGRGVSLAHTLALFAVLVYTWLMTPASSWVWAHVPLLPYVQFPWRLLSVQAFAIGLLVTISVDLVRGRTAWLIVGVSIALVAMAGMAGLRVDRLPLREADITPQRLMLYETYSGNIGTTVRYEYLPREMVPRPFVSAVQLNDAHKPAPLVLDGNLLVARQLGGTPEVEMWELEVSETSLLAFHTTYYPGWEARVDGAAQDVEPLEGLGLVGLRLSPGKHQVVLHWSHTPVRRYATYASLAGLAVWLALGIYPTGTTSSCIRSHRYRRRLSLAAGLGGIALIWLLLAPRILSEPGSMSAKGPLVMDFVRGPYLHAEPEGVYLGEARLCGYTLDVTVADPGAELHIALDWEQPCADCRVRLELLGATAHLFEPSPRWATSEAALDSRRMTCTLSLPADIAPGLYVPQLSVFRNGQTQSVRSARGYAMGALALQPVQVIGHRPASTQEPVVASFGPERALPVIDLVKVQARPSPGLLEVTLTWHSLRQAPLNYALSLRLKRPDGSQVVARDLSPLLGGYPTSLWRPGELVTDRVVLALPEGEVITPRHGLEVVLYDRATLRAMGTATIAGISLPQSQ